MESFDAQAAIRRGRRTRRPPRSTGVTACGGNSSTTPPASSPGQVDKVNVGVIAIVDVAPIYLGKQQGFFSKHNIDLTLVPAQGGAVIVPGVVSGQYQFGFSNVISLVLGEVAQPADQGGQQRQQPRPARSARTSADWSSRTGQPDQDGGRPGRQDGRGQHPEEHRATPRSERPSARPAATRKKIKFVELAFPDMAAALDGRPGRGGLRGRAVPVRGQAKGWTRSWPGTTPSRPRT